MERNGKEEVCCLLEAEPSWLRFYTGTAQFLGSGAGLHPINLDGRKWTATGGIAYITERVKTHT